MMDHLDDAEFAVALAGEELEPDVAGHLEECAPCRRQLAAMKGWIEQRRDHMEQEAPDWDFQRRCVMERLDGLERPLSPRRWLRPALAAAALVALAVGVGVLQQARHDPGSKLAVEEILAETDALLADDSIPGFEAIDPGLEGLQEEVDNGAS